MTVKVSLFQCIASCCLQFSDNCTDHFIHAETLFQKLRASDQVRRDLHNRVMQLSGNIRVYVRVRPALPSELEESTEAAAKAPATRGQKRKHESMDQDESPFSFPGQLAGLDERMAKKSKSFGADDPTKNILEVTEPYKDRGGLSDRKKKWTFGFDHIFDPSHGQDDIWNATEPLVQSAIDGFNVCVLAYGQTGSGKTFTMLGEAGNEGIVTRAVEKLFNAKKEIEDMSRGEKKAELSVELLEVYNEKVRDLLVPNSGSDGQDISLKVTANEAVGSKIVPVASQEEVLNILDKAQKRRCVKATSSNAVSSRSHMIFTILFNVTSKSGASRVGKLHVCDLAGSERLGKSNANERVASSLLRETKHINTSLSVLSNVIEKLQAGDANIPYRESKLTYLLQNSLGGNSKTLAVVCCNPLQSHFHESLCSLRFAAKVNKVDLKAVANFSC
jgi:kinesin family protein C1